jgi:hypothetical protein
MALTSQSTTRRDAESYGKVRRNTLAQPSAVVLFRFLAFYLSFLYPTRVKFRLSTRQQVTVCLQQLIHKRIPIQDFEVAQPIPIPPEP